MGIIKQKLVCVNNQQYKMRLANIQLPQQINQNISFIQQQHNNNITTYNHHNSHFKNRQFHQQTTNLIQYLPQQKLIDNQLSFFPNKQIGNISNQVQNQLTKCSSIAHQDQNQPEDPHMNPILSKIHKKGSRNLNVIMQENDMILCSSDQSLNLQQNQYEKNFNNFSVQLKKTQSYKLSQSQYAHEKPPQIQQKSSNIQNHQKVVYHNFKQTRDACIQVSILKPASQFRFFQSSNISNLSFLQLPSQYKQKPQLVIRLQNSILGSMAESSCFASRNLSRKSPQNRISPRGRIKMPHLEHLQSIHTEQQQQIDESFAMQQSGAIVNKSGVIYEPLNIGIGGIKQQKSMDFRDHIKEKISQDLQEYELPLNSQKICAAPEKSEDQQLALIQNTFILQKLLQFYTMNKQIKEDVLLQLKSFWQQMQSGIKQMLNRCQQMIEYKNIQIERIKNEKNRIQDQLDICRNKLFTYQQSQTNQQGKHNHILTNKNNSQKQDSYSNVNYVPEMHLFNGLKIQISQPKVIISEKQNEPKEVSPFSKNGQRVKLISVDENRKALSCKTWLQTQERGQQLQIWRSAEKRNCNENGIKTIKRKIMKEHYQ